MLIPHVGRIATASGPLVLTNLSCGERVLCPFKFLSGHVSLIVRCDISKTPAYKSHSTRYISFALRGNLMHRILVVDDFRPWRELAREIIEAQPDLQVIAQA